MHSESEKAEPDEEHLGKVQRLRACRFVGFIRLARQVHAIFQHDKCPRSKPNENKENYRGFDQNGHRLN